MFYFIFSHVFDISCFNLGVQWKPPNPPKIRSREHQWHTGLTAQSCASFLFLSHFASLLTTHTATWSLFVKLSSGKHMKTQYLLLSQYLEAEFPEAATGVSNFWHLKCGVKENYSFAFKNRRNWQFAAGIFQRWLGRVSGLAWKCSMETKITLTT